MGYYTDYTLETHKSKMNISDILGNLSENDFGGLNYAIDVYGEYYESVKWYDHEDDMKKLSLKFPDVIFKLHGEGENSGNLWDKYFKNGKMQTCYAVITFDDYDESKLE